MNSNVTENRLIIVTGYYNDTEDHFEYLACIGEESDDIDDDLIFFYFDSPEEVIGNHDDFTITAFEDYV